MANSSSASNSHCSRRNINFRLKTPLTGTTGIMSWAFSFSHNTLQFTILILSTLLLISTPGEGNLTPRHQCYVCLPHDKTSSAAEDIISTFPDLRLSDCTSFNSQNATSFQVDCPPSYAGCQLRTNGSQVSRTCVQHSIKGCKTANSVELCVCATSLCNADHPQRQSFADEPRFPREDETDDEDLIELLGNNEGSGFGYDDELDLPRNIPATTEKSAPSSSSTTTSSSPQPAIHHEPPKNSNEDSHITHNIIPESTGEGEQSESPDAISSNATNLNSIQITFSIISLSLYCCFLVKFQYLY